MKALNFDSLRISFLTTGTLTVFVGTYWIVGTIYTILDVTNKPAALRRYKVQPGTNEPVDTKRLIQVSNRDEGQWE